MESETDPGFPHQPRVTGEHAYGHTALDTSTVRYFDSQLHMLPGITIPLRSMFVESAADAILISPVGTAEEFAAAGAELTTLVAPSLLHHKHLHDAIDRLAPRELWGPPGLVDKKPELAGTKVLGVDAWPYGEILPFVVIEGAPRRNEVVFFHPSTRTIYTADLVFAIQAPQGFLAPLAFRAMGIYKRFGVAKMWSHWVKDPARFRRSIEQVLAWDFDRIAMAHGDIIEDGGKAKLITALRERDLI